MTLKPLFLASFFLLCSLLSAQTKGDLVINWLDKNEMTFGNYKVNIPLFSGNNYNYDPAKRSIHFKLNISESSNFNLHDVILTNIIYEPIPASLLGDLDFKNIPASITSSLIKTQSREIAQTFLIVSPIIKDKEGFKKVVSFSYSLTSGSSKNIQTNKKTNGIINSVLSTGNWHKFYVEKSGVYKISKRFLQQLGLDVNYINPKTIKIYGNGGKMLSLSNALFNPIDLTENAIEIVGENDGVFNTDDYILFYAEGLDTWNEESKTFVNLYETKSYYYITTNGSEGKRIQNMIQPKDQSTVFLTTFDDHQFYEKDINNINKLGRQWFGDSFEINSEQEFNFNFPNIETTTPIRIKASLISAAYTPTTFTINANNISVGSLSFPALNNNIDRAFHTLSFLNNTSFSSSDNIKIKISYNNNSVPGSKGYLDYIELIAKRKLQGFGKQFHFQHDLSSSSQGIASYTVSNATNISRVWDVSDIYNATKIDNPRQDSFEFKTNLGELRKYIAIDLSDLFTPLIDGKSKISNQNLKGTLFKNNQGQFEDIDYVIITPDFLKTQAEKLANFHRFYSKLNTKVITLESIYLEFSSGKQDIAAIRNCIKYIYDNATSFNKRIKYVNLFGDASFDYKNRIPNNNNIVPIYHALNSETSGESSFASDDFFGLMDPNEGNITSYCEGIDIALGRMLVSDNNQASEMVNKIIEYHDPKSFGNWRNSFVLVADDSDKPSDQTLQKRQNLLADKITIKKPFLNVQKILLDSYTQEASAGGYRYPKARSDFFNTFEKGALVFNYLGHGGEDGLSGERIWEKSDGQNLSNQFRYPLFITITCEFSRFDNPLRPTAGEYTYWNPKGGAISMITTIRSIGQYNAENFNDEFSENLLSFDSNQYPSIAEALRISKNKNPNSSANVVFYIGDPALKLSIPKPKIKLTKVNDKNIDQATDDFKSLAKMKLTGQITDENNTPLSNYNGTLSTIIYDKTITKKTLNNDGFSLPMSFNIIGETLFRGNASVTNGNFEFNFVVPRDIRIPVSNGKISFYSKQTDQLENQTGSDISIKVGGINENAPVDNISPKVKLYMNTESFISGGITNESPFLLANLEDENGINTASGIGHDIIAILDGETNNPYVLNDYYQTKLDDYTKGTIRFPLRNLKVGIHTITFKAWDVYNNPTVTEIQFVVTGNETITLTHVLNYPNPFFNYTEFWFTHNKPYEPLEVQVQVMTITGKIVWTKNQLITTEGFLSKEINWNGKDDFGDKIGKGVYVYKLTVKSTLSNQKVEKIEKLVIL
jgi:hypothetical protein